MVKHLFYIKYFSNKKFNLIYLFITYINCITQDLGIIKLPYISINEDNSNSTLRKLVFASNVYGSAFGLNYYYTNLYLGNEMKKQTYILDTGSSITTSPCKPYCKKCGTHLNSYHNVNDKSKIISCNNEKCRIVKSYCGSENRCSFRTSYSEGSSLEGIYINELINFIDDKSKSNSGHLAPIGCTTSENHLFFTQKADGIMGLANNENNFVSVMDKVGAIENNIFSLCFAQVGGYFSLGEINTTFHREEISFLNMEKNSFFYSLNMNNIYINNKKISKYQKNKFSNIIDSGTTISYFPDEIFDEIVDNVKSICNSFENKNGCGKYQYDKDFGPCFLFESTQKMDEAIYQYWPNISFILENYKYKWTPDEYIFNDTNTKRIRGCMGFNKQGGRRFTFGSTWMIDHEIIFDRKNGKIGIAESNCDKNKNKSMNYIGIEKGYNEEMFEDNNYNRTIPMIDYIFSENMLNFYIIITILLFFIIIYLVIVLINIKKRKPNAWLWFMDNPDNEEGNNSFIPIRYDINDTSSKNEKNDKEFSMVFLSDSPINNEIKKSNYSKINA